MKYLIAVFIVIIFVSLFGVAQPIRIQGNNSPTNFLDAPCGVPGICLDCIEDCSDGCDESVCAICVELNCKEEIPVDGGLLWLIIAGFGLKIGHFVKEKRKGKQKIS